MAAKLSEDQARAEMREHLEVDFTGMTVEQMRAWDARLDELSEVLYGPPMFLVMSHGHNGDDPFTENEAVVKTLAQAKESAERLMKTDRYRDGCVLADGTPTVRWVEVFGPGIEESLGLEEVDGELHWGGC